MTILTYLLITFMMGSLSARSSIRQKMTILARQI